MFELIYPTCCAGCGRLGPLICQDCYDLLPIIDSKICTKCGKPSNYLVEECRDCRKKHFFFSQSRSFGLYQGNLRELVRKLKYGNCRGLAEIFAHLLIEHSDAALFEVDVITYVPLSRRKQGERGFNQAQLLANGIASKLGLPLMDLLHQTKETKDQSKLPANDRGRNVKGAFLVKDDSEIEDARILLVDDVFTTGSTVNECSKVILAAGAKLVKVATVARATHMI